MPMGLHFWSRVGTHIWLLPHQKGVTLIQKFTFIKWQRTVLQEGTCIIWKNPASSLPWLRNWYVMAGGRISCLNPLQHAIVRLTGNAVTQWIGFVRFPLLNCWETIRVSGNCRGWLNIFWKGYAACRLIFVILTGRNAGCGAGELPPEKYLGKHRWG